MVECWNNACTKPEHWAIDTGKNNSDRSKLSGVNIRFVQAPGRENGLFLYNDTTRNGLVRDMDIRGQSFEKENETEIARFKSDYAGYTGYDGDVVDHQFCTIKVVSKTHLTSDSCVVPRFEMLTY